MKNSLEDLTSPNTGNEKFVQLSYQHPPGFDCAHVGEIITRTIPVSNPRDIQSGTAIFPPGTIIIPSCDCGAQYTVIGKPNYLNKSPS